MKDIDLINLFQNVLSDNLNSNELDKFINSISSKKGTTQAGNKIPTNLKILRKSCTLHLIELIKEQES